MGLSLGLWLGLGFYIFITNIRQGSKISYYDDFKFRANTNPGPGHYNPHSVEKNEIVKIVVNKTDPKFWIKKHKPSNAKSTGPDIGTYKQNYPVEFKTFGK